MLACFHLVNAALAVVKRLLDNLRGPLLQFVSSARRKCNGLPAAISHLLPVGIKALDALFGFSPHRDLIFSSSIVQIDSHINTLETCLFQVRFSYQKIDICDCLH